MLLRDIVATVAFAATFFSDQPGQYRRAGAARRSRFAQILTLVAFLRAHPTSGLLRGPHGNGRVLDCGLPPGSPACAARVGR